MTDELKPIVPTLPDGTPMKSFKVMMRLGKNGAVEKAIFIDGEMLDWSIDISSFLEAQKMGPKFLQEAKKDIERHFTASVSEVIGRKVTQEDINKAIHLGWI